MQTHIDLSGLHMEDKDVSIAQMMKECIDLVEQVARYPDGKIPDDLADIFPMYKEYILFTEGLLRPFHTLVHNCCDGKEDALFAYFLNKKGTVGKRLTYNEAYAFLSSLSRGVARNILDNYEKIYGASTVYSQIVKSLEDKSEAGFVSAIGNTDCNDFMEALWLVRYVVWNVKGPSEESIKYPCFLGEQYDCYFEGHKDNGCFVASMAKRLAGMKLKMAKSNSARFVINDKNECCEHYDLGWKEQLEYIGDSGKNETGKANELDGMARHLVQSCKEACDYMMFYPIYFHKAMILENVPQRVSEGMASYMDDLWERNHYAYFSLEKSDFINFIIVYLNRCSDTYRLIKDFLDKDRDEDFEKLFGCFGYYPKLVKEDANVARTASTDVGEQKPSKPVKFHKSGMVCGLLQKDVKDFEGNYRKFLKYLYLYASGDDKQVNKIKNHVQYIDSNENDFIHIMGGKLDAGEEISENPCINFSNGQKVCAAILYVYFFGVYEKGKSAVNFNKKNATTDPGKKNFREYIRYDGKEIKKLSDYKHGDTIGNEDIYIKWINVMKEICNHADGKEPD